MEIQENSKHAGVALTHTQHRACAENSSKIVFIMIVVNVILLILLEVFNILLTLGGRNVY